MTNTDTNDTEACAAQIERIDRAGGGIVRLTAQGRREGENLANIVRRVREDGFDTAIVADIHFVPEVAAIAAKYVDKVRINPGNYRTDHGELEALIAQCCERGVALRIGVNHGSLSKRVFDRWALQLTMEQYVLVGSTVKSILSWHLDAGRAETLIEDNRLLWRKA